MNKTISEERLFSYCLEALTASGMKEENALTMSKILVKTDMWGVYTHGCKNLYGYICKAEVGGVSFLGSPSVERNLPAVVVIDGRNTMGYISGSLAMDMACECAKENGIGMALVKNSCHFGATGYYANIAAEQGMLGFATSNVDRKMTIPGARGMIMGHNPFSFAAPAKSIPSIILDISSSNVASLRVLKAKALGESIPPTWISDKDGIPTTDPRGYPDEGALLPMGNHKGYGIAMFMEIMTSVLLAKETSTRDEVTSWCFDMDKPNNVCHTFIAIDPELIAEGDFAERVESFITDLHNAPKAKGNDRILVPGEDMWERYDKAKQEGISLPGDVWYELEKISRGKNLKTKLAGD